MCFVAVNVTNVTVFSRRMIAYLNIERFLRDFTSAECWEMLVVLLHWNKLKDYFGINFSLFFSWNFQNVLLDTTWDYALGFCDIILHWIEIEITLALWKSVIYDELANSVETLKSKPTSWAAKKKTEQPMTSTLLKFVQLEYWCVSCFVSMPIECEWFVKAASSELVIFFGSAWFYSVFFCFSFIFFRNRLVFCRRASAIRIEYQIVNLRQINDDWMIFFVFWLSQRNEIDTQRKRERDRETCES